MGHFKISKYNPQNVINGRYIKAEWTDYSDIGEKFQGEILTEEEYLIIERRYISCIEDIIKKSNIRGFYVTCVEKYKEECLWHNEQYIENLFLEKIITDCLRNKCWCKLLNNGYYIHFGYDYYVYVAVPLTFEKVDEICKKYNLFCEIKKSPYMDQN